MQLHFSKQFPDGEPTYFIEKIWSGFALNDFLWNNRNGCWSTESFKEKFPHDYDWFPVFMASKPKIHTIRDDPKDRWHSGKDIHFMQWIGKPYRSPCYHFAPVIQCVSTQKLDIRYEDGSISVFVDDNLFYYQTAFVERYEPMLQLAINDGFASMSDFFKFFNKDYTGKIIHWTDLKY